jgi:hypothetical protein
MSLQRVFAWRLLVARKGELHAQKAEALVSIYEDWL